MSKSKSRIISFYRKILIQNWPSYTLLVVFMVTSVLLGILVAYAYKEVIDSLNSGILVTILAAGAMYAVINVLNGVLSVLLAAYNAKICKGVSIKLKKDILNRMLNQDGPTLFAADSAEYTSLLIKDAENAVHYVDAVIFPIALAVLRILAMVVFLFFIEWRLLLFVMLLQPLTIFTQKKLHILMERAAKVARNNTVSFLKITKDYTSNLFDIISSGQKNYFIDKFVDALNKHKQSEYRVAVIEALANGINGFLNLLPTIVILIYGGMEVAAGSLTVGSLIVYLEYYQGLFSPINELLSSSLESESFIPSIEHILEIINKETAVEKNSEKSSMIPKTISFHDICFSYPNGINILKNFNYVFEAGKTYGVCGASGAGKSTLCKLIMGFLQPSSGKIFFDDINIASQDRDRLISKITYVSQNGFLFNCSAEENIFLGETYDSSMFHDAIHMVNLDELISSLPNNEEKILGDDGSLISGGQRRRIELARAFVRTSPVLILDEPTNGLDEKNAIEIIERLRIRYSKGIIILISHQTEVLKLCDEIIDFGEGLRNEKITDSCNH